MNTQKVAITIPTHLVVMIDAIAKKRDLSRSKFISNLLEVELLEEKKRSIKQAYDRVFFDNGICREQLETSAWLNRSENPEGVEW